jgi:hypothetical protein
MLPLLLFLVYIMQGRALNVPPCKGNSSALLRQDCEAFYVFYEKQLGWNWPFCSNSRRDPCGCPHIECTVVQGDILGADVDVLAHSKEYDFNWESIPNSANSPNPELYITALFLANQRHNVSRCVRKVCL